MTFAVGFPICNEGDALLDETLRAIGASTVLPRRVLVVDNGDREWSRAWSRASPIAVEVVRPYRNLGVSGSYNLLHRLSAPEPVILLNADCAVAPDTFERLLVDPAEVVLGYGFGCFRMAERIWDEVGGFDEGFWPAYYEDADLRLRLKLAGVAVHEWDIFPQVEIGPGRNRAPSGIAHGKHDPEGYQGWRGEKLAWFWERFEANKKRFVEKWGGMPAEETYSTPWNRG